MSNATEPNRTKRRHGIVALSLAGLVAGMVGLAFASVPLYRMFCQVTGYGGMPQRAEKRPGEVLDRTIRVRFDGNVDHGLPWTFAPVQQTMDVKIGETALAFYKATNQTSAPVERHRNLQRRARACRPLLHQDRMLLLQAADARRRAERRDAGDLLRRSEDRR